MDYDDYDEGYDRPRYADLTYANKGYRLCENCEGCGVVMIARMLPTGHTECDECCPECDGEGQLEIELIASVSRNKREGGYAGKQLTIRGFSTRMRRHRRTGRDTFPPL